MKQSNGNGAPLRAPLLAESHVPMRLQRLLRDLESTTSSDDVWTLILDLGRSLDLPFIDFISASDFRDWKKTLFIRTSYEADWLHTMNLDPEVYQWSYFRSHGATCLTPIAIGLEFMDEYHDLPIARQAVLREAARRGIRAGFSIPLRQHVPPQAAFMTFAGDHSRKDMLAILKDDGWTLNAGALMAHQRFLHHFSQEFSQRNQITDKQADLLELIGRGLLDKQIADKLQVSVSAVRQRQNALMQKTGMSNRAELAALAMSIGLLPHPLNRPNKPQVTVVETDTGPTNQRDDT